MTPEARSPEHAALGAAIRELREEKGLTQQELAKRADVASTFLSDVERGTRNPSWSTVLALSKALGAPVSKIAKRAEQ